MKIFTVLDKPPNTLYNRPNYISYQFDSKRALNTEALLFVGSDMELVFSSSYAALKRQLREYYAI